MEYISGLSKVEDRNNFLLPHSGSISGYLFDNLREIPTFCYNIVSIFLDLRFHKRIQINLIQPLTVIC